MAKNKRHKWDWSDGYLRAKCKVCGAKIKRVVRKTTRGRYGDTVDEIFVAPDGTESKMPPTPPCSWGE